MKVSVAAIVLFLTSLTSAQGQYTNGGLVLEGTIFSVVPEVVSEPRPSRYTRNSSLPPPPATQRLVVHVQLYLRFKNEGTAPLIVLEPVRCLCDKSIEFFEGIPYSVNDQTPVIRVLQKNEEWRTFPAPRYPNDYDPFSQYVGSLDRSVLPDGVFIIEPGRSHDFRDTVTVDAGYRVEWQAGKTVQDMRTQTVLPDFPAFRVEYRLSVKGRKDHPNLFLNLQNRWKRFGHLVIAGDEEILIRSQPIINIPGR